MFGSFGRIVIAISVIAALAVALIPAAHAAGREEVRLVRGVEGRVLGPTGEVTRSPARRITAAELVEGRFTTFVVDLDAFPAAAREAMRYALRSVGKVVMSRIPTVVQATWQPLEGDTVALGSSYAHLLTGGFAGEGMWFADALGNSLLNEDIDPSQPEIVIKIDSDEDWYFGTDGKGSASQVDFVTTVMHELIHGLGFYSELEVVNGEGRWGLRGSIPKTDPVRFDVFVENGDGAVLISDFDNPSVELATQITSENVFFGGPTATTSNGGSAPALYAPPVYTPASVAHLDRIFDGTQDSVITPFVGNPNHNIGPVIRGVLADLAYLIAHARKISFVAQKHLMFTGRVSVPFGYPGCRSNITVLIQRLKNREWVKVASVKTNVNGAFKAQPADRAGRYRAKINRQNKGPLNFKTHVCLEVTSATLRHRH